ncbi:MAG: hypothetical protein V3W18_11340 [candidate division Zixibacteria bacterium]
MSKSTVLTTILFVCSHYGIANAVSTRTYTMVQESIFLAVSLACLLWALRIFLALRGGSLQTPWLFLIIGFALAVTGGALHLLDILKIAFYEYDLRPAFLATTCGSVIFIFLGLYVYKRGLD